MVIGQWNVNATSFKPKQAFHNQKQSSKFETTNEQDSKKQNFTPKYGSKDDSNVRPGLKCWICGGQHYAQSCDHNNRVNPKPVQNSDNQNRKPLSPCTFCSKTNHKSEVCFMNPNRVELARNTQ